MDPEGEEVVPSRGALDGALLTGRIGFRRESPVEAVRFEACAFAQELIRSRKLLEVSPIDGCRPTSEVGSVK